MDLGSNVSDRQAVAAQLDGLIKRRSDDAETVAHVMDLYFQLDQADRERRTFSILTKTAWLRQLSDDDAVRIIREYARVLSCEGHCSELLFPKITSQSVEGQLKIKNPATHEPSPAAIKLSAFAKAVMYETAYVNDEKTKKSLAFTLPSVPHTTVFLYETGKWQVKGKPVSFDQVFTIARKIMIDLNAAIDYEFLDLSDPGHELNLVGVVYHSENHKSPARLQQAIPACLHSNTLQFSNFMASFKFPRCIDVDRLARSHSLYCIKYVQFSGLSYSLQTILKIAKTKVSPGNNNQDQDQAEDGNTTTNTTCNTTCVVFHTGSCNLTGFQTPTAILKAYIYMVYVLQSFARPALSTTMLMDPIAFARLGETRPNPTQGTPSVNEGTQGTPSVNEGTQGTIDDDDEDREEDTPKPEHYYLQPVSPIASD